MTHTHSLPGRRRMHRHGTEPDLESAVKKMERMFAVGDNVLITKMGNHMGDLAVVLKEKATEGSRIRVKLLHEGITRSYFSHELKKLQPKQPEHFVEKASRAIS